MRSSKYIIRAAVAVFCLSLPASVPAAGQSVFTGFKGQLIVASPRMPSSTFSNSVVYIFFHEVSGAGGVIINKPGAEIPIAEIYRLAELEGGEKKFGEEQVPLFFGGPVQPTAAFVLHEAETSVEGSQEVDGRYVMTDWTNFLSAIDGGEIPERALFILGIAAWRPGQLESEVIEGVWVTADPEAELVFTDDVGTLWERIAENPQSKL